MIELYSVKPSVREGSPQGKPTGQPEGVAVKGSTGKPWAAELRN